MIAGQGDSLTVRADENVMEYVETHVRGGVLRIGIDKRINSLHNVEVEVTVPDNGDIRLLKASSAASIVCDEPLARQDRVQLTASSAARPCVRPCVPANVASERPVRRLSADWRRKPAKRLGFDAARVRMVVRAGARCGLRPPDALMRPNSPPDLLGKRLECGERHGTLRRVARRSFASSAGTVSLCGRRRRRSRRKQRGSVNKL